MSQTKQLYKVTLAVYVLFLAWLVLFKTSTDFLSVLADYNSRSLNLIPFWGYSAGTAREMIDNLVVFVPLGVLLAMNYKATSFWKKLVYVLTFSVSVELLQYLFAIGTTDVTDVIMNTAGGLLGLGAYGLVGRHTDNKKLDLCISIILTFLLVVFMLLRFLVFRVRY